MPAEHAERRARLLEHATDKGVTGVVLFDADYIRYFSGFNFLATERPVAVSMDAGGALAAFVPEFEVERVRAETDFERIDWYPEYPGEVHPMRLLARTLADMGVGGAIGADQDGYPGILGYLGPALSEATGAQVTVLAGPIESMLARKSEAELALIRESGKWCAVAHRLLQQYSAARSAAAARGRTPSRTTSSSSPATCSSPRPARRSGATTRSSSARW